MIVQRQERRRGFVAALLVVILMVLTLLTGVLLKIMLMRQTDLHSAERRLQAEWLAESGLERGLAKLAINPDYKGETWELLASEFAGRDDGAVLITVETVPGKPTERIIRARGDYPKPEHRRSRETRTISLNMNSLTQTKSTDSKGDAKK